MSLWKALRYKFLLLTLFSMGHFSIAQEKETEEDKAELKVIVTGFRAIKGEARMLIFDQPDGFPGTGEKALAFTRARVEGKSVEANFVNLKIGKRYAVVIYHDENDNRNFDSNFLGIPTEGYGTSNNVTVLRSPTFEETSFILESDGQTLQIKLFHLF